MNVLRKNEAARLGEGVISLSLIQVANALLPILVWPYLIRVLGLGEFGVVVFAATISAYLLAIVDYGFNYTVTKEVVHSQSADQLRELFFNTIYTKLALVLFTAGVLLFLSISVPAIRQHFILVWLSFLIVPAGAITPTWYFHGVNRLLPLASIHIVEKITVAVMLFWLIEDVSDMLMVPIITGGAAIVGGAISIRLALHLLPLGPRVPIRAKAIRTRLKHGFDVFVDVFSPNLYSTFSIVLLGMFSAPAAVALVESARKIVAIVDQGLNVVARAALPIVVKRFAARRRVQWVLVIIAAGAAMLLAILAEEIVNVFFGHEHYEAATIIRILAIGMVGLALKLVFGVLDLLVSGRTRELRTITLTSSFIAFGVALVLIPSIGAEGAAWAIVAGRVLQACGVLVATRKSLMPITVKNS